MSTRSLEKLLFLLQRLTIRLTTLLLAANRKASWNKARIRYKRCTFHWTIWIRGHQTTARGPEPARELISSGPPRAVEITAALELLRKKS